MNKDLVINPLKLYNFARFNTGISTVLVILATLLVIPPL